MSASPDGTTNFSSANEAIEDRKSNSTSCMTGLRAGCAVWWNRHDAKPTDCVRATAGEGGCRPSLAGTTMSIHKLTAGSGVDYLTRQVAALDATEKGHVPLASYYAERGESPGVWIGSGLAGIDGLKAGDPVTAEQMRALFGVGLHPLAAQRQQHCKART